MKWVIINSAGLYYGGYGQWHVHKSKAEIYYDRNLAELLIDHILKEGKVVAH